MYYISLHFQDASMVSQRLGTNFELLYFNQVQQRQNKATEATTTAAATTKITKKTTTTTTSNLYE